MHILTFRVGLNSFGMGYTCRAFSFAFAFPFALGLVVGCWFPFSWSLSIFVAVVQLRSLFLRLLISFLWILLEGVLREFGILLFFLRKEFTHGNNKAFNSSSLIHRHVLRLVRFCFGLM